MMYIQYSDITLNVETHINNSTNSKCLFLIHGFTGSAKDWKNISPDLDDRFNIYMIDLIGHGRSESPDEPFLYSQYSIVDQLKEILVTVNSPYNVMLGYSMGGRAALSFAVKHQDFLHGLILESSSPGIKEEISREQRISSDENLAKFINKYSLEEFLDYWMKLDIFATQRRFSAGKMGRLKEDKMINNKLGLVNSLKGFGTGAMMPLYDDLKDLNIKTLLISGELDTKFTIINYEMASELPFACHEIIKHAGHNTHLEEPAQFVGTVNNFLKEL